MTDLQTLPGTKPQAAAISSGLVDGTDPLDFIKRNLQQPQPAQHPPAPQPTATEQIQEAIKQNFVDPTTGLELPLDPPKPQPQPQPQPQQEEQSKDKGPEESIKQLRKKANELSKLVEEKGGESEKLQAELERYKKGEAVPEVVEQYKQRIQELEHYEQLHALRMSKGYTQKYIEPLEQLKTKAISIAEDYGVDPSILDKALAINNKRELNNYLRVHFDDVGALEVKDILGNIKSISKEAQEAEAAPQKTLQSIREEQEQHEQRAEKQRIERISSSAKGGWVSALTDLRESGNYPEFIISGNEEQDKYARAVLNEAATEYGKFVKELGLTGVNELRPEAAKVLAKRYLLSQAAAIAMESRVQHHKRAEELIEETKRQAPFIRPQVGGGAVSAPIGEAKRPSSPTEAADILLQKVGLR